MRKIFAYVVTVVTLLAMMIFFVPSIKENTNFAMEYTGGFEILYKAKSKMDGVKDKEIAKTISDGMSKVLEINGTNDAIITVEDSNYVRVNVTSKNQMISDEIKDLLQNNESYEITFRDSNDKKLATGKEILEKVAASYDGEINIYGQPIIYLNIKDTDLLNSITTDISNATTKNLVIWVGFQEGVDSYANIETDSATAKKVIYNATVSSPLNDEVITVSGQYTEEEAKNTVNLINSGTFDYELETVQIKSVKETVANTDRTLVLISMAIATILPMIAMVVYFKSQGAFSTISILTSEFLTLFFFNKIVGVINYQALSAFILINVVLFTLLFILLNKYKSVLKTNKSPIKAYKETFKKNGPIILDSVVTMLLFSLATYFAGTNAHNFAIIIAVASVAIFISLYLLQRFVMYLTCDCFNKNDKVVIVSNNSAKEENTTSDTKDIESYTKPAFISFISLISLGLIIILVTSLAFKKPFTFYDDAKDKSTIEIIATEEYFTSDAEVKEFFEKDNLDVELSSIELKKEENKYHIIVTSDDNVAQIEQELKKELKAIYGENTAYEEFYIVYINDYSTSALAISLKSTLFTSGIALVLIAAYFALRYKYSYSLATITSIVMTVLSMIAFFGVTRVPVNSSTIIGISIACAYSLFILVPLFTKVKEYMLDTKKIYLSYQERVDCFKKGRNSIALPMIVSTLVLDFISLVIMFFDLSNFSMYLSFILGSGFALVFNMIFVPKVWVLFENKSDKRKRTFKNKNISKSKYRTLDEQVFIGLND